MTRVGRRTVIGAALAVAAIVWVMDALDLDRDVMLEYLVGSFVLVGSAVASAAAIVWLVKSFRN